jgi:RNA polymerase sigma-70 factor (ECF subfamily)
MGVAMSDPSTTQLQVWLQRWNAGDAAARELLLRHTCDRLRHLARHMLRDFQRLRSREETDDVLQTALVRLQQALEDVRPASIKEFFALATVQIRRVLIDLSRHHFGPLGAGRREQPLAAPPGEESRPQYEGEDTTHEPGQLASWREFHEQVEALPPEEREVFDLLWYQDLSQADAAALLEVSVPTVKRRWLSARLRLREALKDSPAD